MGILTNIANKYGTDKGTIATDFSPGERLHYTPLYEKYFDDISKKNIKLLEIGVETGWSIRMWYEYFTNGRIYGVDINDTSRFNNNRIACYAADQANRNQLKGIMDVIGEVDFIIDDGGHYMHQQQISFGFLFKYVKSGGKYFIEDLHTSYWPYGKHTCVYNSIPIDIDADRQNTTVNMLKNYEKNGKITSKYLTEEELNYLNTNIEKLDFIDTPTTNYGPNHLAVFYKK